ncbi:hypothetical protein [Planktothricoides raciborskii]|uniref:hypothetical protein n=1 Tax=Planktothricoides raciborskii TaxID=132608 RepID=UPI0016865EF7|nr:hypothetical protein [Planktothricoides raciborskii]MBD2584520.1 hypothetical protein [Planktothricoides raciborskii FACHB-1261]
MVSETGFLSVTPQLTIISTTETRFLYLGTNAIAYWVSETGFLSVTPQLTIISTTETRFLFLSYPQDSETGFLPVTPQ